MPEFEDVTCKNCGNEFRAHASANAARNGYCSPRCETEGRGL
jgi:hypothetical protein